MLSKLAAIFAALACVVAVGTSYLQSTVWWAGYDIQNCSGCSPIIDWSDENNRETVTSDRIQAFKEDGVVLLPSAIMQSKVIDLTYDVESLSDTFMTSVLAKVVLKQYNKYEHKLDTRSEIIRDWAIHGPLAQWAAELMQVDSARLYNCEKIYSSGSDGNGGCNTAWHRDTIAAPFPTSTKSITFNIYLDDIGADGPHGDVLIYAKGSHRNLATPPDVTKNVYEPNLKIGDVMAHDAHIYHTSSGRGCWNRRSLQFRYVESPTTFTFEPNRFPSGPVPWTLAHAAGVAPHGLKEGSPLEGPWYPQVYPKPLKSEHVAIEGKPWGILSILSAAKEAQDIASDLGIGNSENCTLDNIWASEGRVPYFGFDGPITSCNTWEMINGVPVHKEGQMKQSVQRMTNGGK